MDSNAQFRFINFMVASEGLQNTTAINRVYLMTLKAKHFQNLRKTSLETLVVKDNNIKDNNIICVDPRDHGQKED